jgi:glycogen synthase
VKNFEINLQIARGSDFIVIPSVYQPGGIVQHNSLLAGTPVIAF